MSTQKDSLALLPNGFVDLLPPDAENEAQAIQILMNRFSAFGYQRIKPPLFEFEDSLLAPGPGERMAMDTFRLMDPVSHRMLGVRSDITTQVSRIVSSRLKKEDRPLRLTYANDVLRTKGSQNRTERQFAQVGCELIGDSQSIEADIEICILAVMGLKDLGIHDITLDMTIPGFVNSLMHEVKEENVEAVITAVDQRDPCSLEKLNDEGANNIASVMGVSGYVDDLVQKSGHLTVPKDMQEQLTRLQQLCTGLEIALKDLGIEDVSLTIDLLEQRGFEYHKLLGFTLFSSNMRGELGRGGCYDVHFGQGDQDEMARGFTLYMDTISKRPVDHSRKDQVFVSSAEPWSVIMDLQKQGWIVVRGIESEDMPTGCSHEYRNGKVKEIGK